MGKTPDARFDDLHSRYAAQIVPASKIRMLRCECCKQTFFDGEGRNRRVPGKHRCGAQLRWVWVE